MKTLDLFQNLRCECYSTVYAYSSELTIFWHPRVDAQYVAIGCTYDTYEAGFRDFYVSGVKARLTFVDPMRKRPVDLMRHVAYYHAQPYSHWFFHAVVFI